MIVWWPRLAHSAAIAAAFLVVQTPAPKETFLEKLLRIAGITAAPSQMRGPSDEVLPGNIWTAQASGGAAKALTTDGGYRSPVFSPSDGMIYALRENAIVRVPIRGGAAARVADAPGAVKLVGFDRSSPDEIVVLLDDAAGSPLGVVSVRTGKITRLPYDPDSKDEQRALTQVRGQDRVYGKTTLYIKTETKQGLSRPIEWTDVYMQRDGAPRNVSACDGVNCVQPALSPDGRTVAFIKAEE
jgi:hypothetical protein